MLHWTLDASYRNCTFRSSIQFVHTWGWVWVGGGIPSGMPLDKQTDRQSTSNDERWAIGQRFANISHPVPPFPSSSLSITITMTISMASTIASQTCIPNILYICVDIQSLCRWQPTKRSFYLETKKNAHIQHEMPLLCDIKCVLICAFRVPNGKKIEHNFVCDWVDI